MIGQLRGTVVYRDLQTLTLDVGGVGYELEVPITVQVPGAGTLASRAVAEVAVAPGGLAGGVARSSEMILYTHLVVREDAQLLFGFATRGDRDVFRRLIRVNGIGARLALAMLSSFSAGELVQTIESGNVAALTRIPGIGKKTAERVVLELAGKLERVVQGAGDARGREGVARARDDDEGSARETDVRAALEVLGYKSADIDRMLATVRADASLVEQPAEAWVRAALRSTVLGRASAMAGASGAGMRVGPGSGSSAAPGSVSEPASGSGSLKVAQRGSVIDSGAEVSDAASDESNPAPVDDEANTNEPGDAGVSAPRRRSPRRGVSSR